LQKRTQRVKYGEKLPVFGEGGYVSTEKSRKQKGFQRRQPRI